MLKCNLIKVLISLAAIIFLVETTNWIQVKDFFNHEYSVIVLAKFLLVATVITIAYGYRWRLLLNEKMPHSASLSSSIISLGGNMFLPVRGGDLLRVQYSQKIAEIGYASLLSRLLIEKFLDFLVIVAIGILALMHIHGPSAFLGYSKSLIEITFVLVTLIIVTLVIKYLNVILLSWFRSVFRLAGKEDFFQRHIAQLAHDARGCLNVRNMIPPFVVTLFMWLSAYALSYILAASFVGVELSYSEALLIMAAGALGLMLPAAPSGIGTFHASIVSAFLFIGRSSTEGLLVATSIHLLFFVAFALPAALICGSWRVGKTVPG